MKHQTPGRILDGLKTGGLQCAVRDACSSWHAGQQRRNTMTRKRWDGKATPAQHSRQCTATTRSGDPCQGRAQLGMDTCGPHTTPVAKKDHDGAPSWRTVIDMEQARFIRTARRYRNELPAPLARLADCTSVSQHDAKQLAQWCATNGRPLERAGRT